MKKPQGVITHPHGFHAAGVHAGIKTTKGVPDVAVLTCEVPTSAAALFTTNEVCAAPVHVSREHMKTSKGKLRAVVVNSGNANACTGKQGLADARLMTELTAELLHIDAKQTLVASTGVIGRPLPMEKIEAGITKAVNELSADLRGGGSFTRGIMTTDRFPKEAETSLKMAGKTVRVAGVVKGAGMIAPNMATMLAFITTDAEMTPKLLHKLLKASNDKSFNRITVDSHMSTNDTVIAMASGLSRLNVRAGSPMERKFADALGEVMLELALNIVRDGEGAVRVAEIRVEGAKTNTDAELAARAIADSPLVKTALFGNDPNWGRIVSAAGASGCAFKEEKASLKINGHAIYKLGKPLEIDKFVESAMTQDHVTFRLELGLGRGSTVVYTCDLGHDYVTMNADYTT